MSNERERIKYTRKQFCAKGREKGHVQNPPSLI